MKTEKKLMKGNEAFAEAAIRAGSRYYFGYPITPQNEIAEYMSRELGKHGGSFIQAESELAAINMAYGASAAGGRVFISSSSPGIALMQEGFSFISSAQIPLVAVNVSRGGPGVGGIQPGQADYEQATRGGGNGDYHLLVYAPASIQEAVDMIYAAFDIADDYRNPVMVYADGMLGQMMEPVIMPDFNETTKEKPWAITGHKGLRDRNAILSLNLQPESLEKSVDHIFEKYEKAQKELPDYEAISLEDAEIVFVAYGSVSRVVKEAIALLKQEGIKAGLIRPKTLWPFPEEAFDHISGRTKVIMSAELSKGQMVQDIRLGAAGRWPISLVSHTGGVILTSEEIISAAKKELGVK